ncbi:MAG: 4'-phosphopantetheinyl transferase superfamily protein [Treponema sp.]|jgi:phosphopantetheinyl transferase|nr:4'-phosphopantetheinyl transferase superfamily protein [Treponema sp.]
MTPLYIGISLLSNKEKDSLHKEGRRILGLLAQEPGAYEPIDHLITREPGGKPYFIDRRGDFNISHAGRMVAVTYTQERSTLRGLPLRTGCDIEYLYPRGNLEAIASRFFSSEEQAYITEGTRELERLTRFYQLWVLKECFLKTLGLGVNRIKHTPSFIHGNTLEKELTYQEFGSTCNSECTLTLYLYELGNLPEEPYILALAQERNPGRTFLSEGTAPHVYWFSQESLPLRNRVEIRAQVRGIDG